MDHSEERGEHLHDLVAALDYSMFVVTTAAGDQRAGCLVGFAAQCSISPFRFMVWLSKKNHTYEVARGATTLAVHTLSRRERELARLFGSHTGWEEDKFPRCSWRPGPDGVPLLDDCPGLFTGEILDRHDTGDHVGFLLRPTSAVVRSAARPPLTFQDVRDFEPGNAA
ncbi:flavin reductase (DIM6/NTAB) family NADH-FMN oxidoreductase RutF [Amycolatopsis bartoniae]|uniref:Oxidoreductase n=1 Tax=Amycolatopsis bartoniae TaxID=941986 RepID=A0A8H9ISV0_9PSEU|nr:flavin reductase family protein [Amycolatopsis bartoniae]MBB2939326.1 flavin reductase (DIM6/NTAB) family NADH-FMN oxidoreductase RutF [Amycolatopsis bartoniae]TVT08775.1 flavin reductase [Amycolatopsis bartoniae]GHF37288.1 oxidoreductase [Amycolatopsis bartoniae]